MPVFQNYYDEIKQLLDYEDYPQLTKRLIDLTLDTGSIACYRKTVALLDWLDTNTNRVEIRAELTDSLEYLYENLKNKPVKTSAGTPLLSVENLIKSYKKSSFALGPISFHLNEGEIIGLVGENGNGKTTLLRSLCGELQPTSGKITYSFAADDTYTLRSHLIYIPQRTTSWHGLLLTNLQFTASSYGIKGEENELIVQLVIARMGLRKLRNYCWKDLSSGYKMRFELARALLRNPKLLLIDEPLANLDILAQQIVLDDLRDIAKSPFRPIGIMLSSQQLYEVEKTSDNVIFLKNGAPRNLFTDTDVTYTEIPRFIIEFDSEWSMNELSALFSQLKLEKLQLNGGTYVACFPDSITQEMFLNTMLDNKVPMNYFRNISRSTRRFFLS